MKVTMIKKALRILYVRWLCIIGKAVDISSDGRYPGAMLSNFTPYEFTFRGKRFLSMESLLQGLKFETIETQNGVFERVGVKAKLRGKKRKWYLDQTLYWQGTPMKRDSEEYKNIVREAFYALAENIDFQQTLLATGSKRLYHTMGKSDPTRTILTEAEFCSTLTEIRNELQKQR